MRTYRIPSVLAVLVTMMIAGWGATAHALTTVAPEYLSRHYEPEMVHRTAKSGGLFVEVRANGATDRQSVADRALAAMQRSRLGSATTLTLDPDRGRQSATRVVVLFDPSLNTDYSDACRGEGKSEGRSLEKVMMTLCHEGAPVSSVTASNGGATSVDSPAFANMLRQAATTVFPQRGGDLTGQGFWNEGQRN